MKKRQVGIPNTSELDDDQIEALIRKLSAIKGSAPELLAALQDEASSRIANGSSRGGGSRSQQRATAAGVSASAGRTAADRRRGGGGPIRPVYGEEEDDDDYEEEEEETESEEEDEFDEDGPCVGHGYSDDASVISEMTTPTVVSNLNVPDEERYNEIHQGYSAITRSKKPDLLSQVNRMNAARNKQQPLQSQRATATAAAANNNNGEPIDPMKRKAYTSGLSAMAKISEGEPASVTKPQRKPSAAAGTSSGPAKSRRAPQPPQRKNSHDGSIKNRTTGRGLKKKPSTKDKDGEEVAGSKSPRMKKKSSSNHGKTKSSGSHGSGSGSGSGERRARSSGEKGSKDFADNWHKSLSGADFDETNMDDNGFPFSFGDDPDNAFGTSKSSGWGKPSSGSAGQTDAFDPFDAGGGFDSSFQAAAAATSSSKGPQKKPSSGSRGSGRPARPKRETSPRRKSTR